VTKISPLLSPVSSAFCRDGSTDQATPSFIDVFLRFMSINYSSTQHVSCSKVGKQSQANKYIYPCFLYSRSGWYWDCLLPRWPTVSGVCTVTRERVSSAIIYSGSVTINNIYGFLLPVGLKVGHSCFPPCLLLCMIACNIIRRVISTVTDTAPWNNVSGSFTGIGHDWNSGVRYVLWLHYVMPVAVRGLTNAGFPSNFPTSLPWYF
jgi:hypothetical protein